MSIYGVGMSDLVKMTISRGKTQCAFSMYSSIVEDLDLALMMP